MPATPPSVKSPYQPNLTLRRDEEIIPVARKLLAALAERSDIPMGSTESYSNEASAAYYQKLYQDVLVPVLIEHNVRLCDLSYLFQIMGQPINLLKSISDASFAANHDRADALLWGVNDPDDVRVSDLDNALKTGGKARGVGQPVELKRSWWQRLLGGE